MAKIMFLECVHGRDKELLYATCVAREVAKRIREETDAQVIEVEQPSPEDANKVILDEKPDLVWWIGHGNAKATTLENVELWIQEPDTNTGILDGAVGVAHSCLTGRSLGEYVASKGNCMAYLGYDVLYYFQWCGSGNNCACQGSNPWGVREDVWEVIVKATHRCTLMFVVAMASGYTAKGAYDESIKMFNQEIEELKNVDPQSEAERSVIKSAIWVLKHDRDGQVLHGDEGHKIAVGQPSLMGGTIAMGALAIGAVGSMLARRKG